MFCDAASCSRGCADQVFLYALTRWNPKFTKETGFDQFGRLQSDGPAPQGAKGVWEHRVVSIGNVAPYHTI
jgi:hypothetical protein